MEWRGGLYLRCGPFLSQWGLRLGAALELESKLELKVVESSWWVRFRVVDVLAAWSDAGPLRFFYGGEGCLLR